MKVKVAHGRKPKEIQPKEYLFNGEKVTLVGMNGKTARIRTSNGDVMVLAERLEDVLQAESMGEHEEGDPSQG